MPISFFVENIDYKLKNIAKLKLWIKTLLKKHNVTKANINYIFCNDAYLLDINQTHLNHDTLTDIITFDLKENLSSTQMVADIYISIDRVTENATENNCLPLDELLRVMCHGILHLRGHKDKSKTEALAMRAAEESCICLYYQTNNVPRGTLK
jgi:probable rRNA maturation factor